jgi:phospholipid/cholesterol/gamma-HCH transport system ATP-binding protein
MDAVVTPVVELRCISMRFGQQLVLQDIQLEVRAGETLVIVGESGCGKSVTLKLMNGLLEPTVGSVHWDGIPVTSLRPRQLNKKRLKFGFVFQMAALFDSLSVFDNVSFGLEQNPGLAQGDAIDTVRRLLREVGLNFDAVARKRPAELSGGMRKRVALARALALRPEVLLHDEPTTGLDPIMSDVINELILQTASNGITNVVVTHDMHTVRRVADRVIMLSPLSRLETGEPQIIFEGTSDEAFASTDPRVAQFIRGEAGGRLHDPTAA